jgi:hypothetical protein
VGESVVDLRVKAGDFGHVELALQANGRILPGVVSGSTNGDDCNPIPDGARPPRRRARVSRHGLEAGDIACRLVAGLVHVISHLRRRRRRRGGVVGRLRSALGQQVVS